MAVPGQVQETEHKIEDWLLDVERFSDSEKDTFFMVLREHSDTRNIAQRETGKARRVA